MVVEYPSEGRNLLRLVSLGFDRSEELFSAQFLVSLPVHLAVVEALGEDPFALVYDSVEGPGLTLSVPQIRTLVEHFARPETPKTREADAVFERLIVILGTYRPDLL